MFIAVREETNDAVTALLFISPAIRIRVLSQSKNKTPTYHSTLCFSAKQRSRSHLFFPRSLRHADACLNVNQPRNEILSAEIRSTKGIDVDVKANTTLGHSLSLLFFLAFTCTRRDQNSQQARRSASRHSVNIETEVCVCVCCSTVRQTCFRY